MSETRRDEQFEEWVRFVFDHPVPPRGEQEWYWQDEAEPEFQRWAADPTLNVTRMTQLFREPTRLAPFSRAQIAQGLWFLLGPSPCDFGEDLYETAVERGVRLACVEATPSFFAEFVSVQCARATTAYRNHDADELEVACFMWWDLWPDTLGREPGADSEAVDSAVLDALAAIGSLRSVACIESALHGLGHRHETNPERVEGIIEEMLRRSSEWPSDLVEYAAVARLGKVQ